MPKRYCLFLVLATAMIAMSIPQMLLAQTAIMETAFIPTSTTWPLECTVWHEIVPNYCITAHQTAHSDNGDGMISACDFIWLNGVQFHITWVGPTYYLDCDQDGLQDAAYEPLEPQPGDPSCQEWIQVWPEYGPMAHVDAWIDANGNGEIDFCDTIVLGGEECHVQDVFLNIHISDDLTPTEESTWSKMKRMFTGGLF